jgi:serine/threonine-protein kinase
VLHRELTTVPEVVARFEREAMAAANIDHPNVAAATDFGKLPDGAVFLVLEYVQGKNLRDEIAQGPFSVERALHIARQIASALGSAHALDIVHRDLKPENVMLVDKGGDSDFVKVLDFGIAKVPMGDGAAPGSIQGPQPITKVGMVFGTPEYMSPEQALGQAVDGRADLYALGVMLFEMLAGVRPFSSKSQVGILGQQLGQAPPKVADRSPGIRIPAQVEQIIQKLLAKELGERYQKADEVGEAIGVLLGAPAGRGLHRFTMGIGSPAAVRGSQPSLGSLPDVSSHLDAVTPPPRAADSAGEEQPWPFGEEGRTTAESASDGTLRAGEGPPDLPSDAPSPSSAPFAAALDLVDRATRALPAPLRRPLRRLPPAVVLGGAALSALALLAGAIVLVRAATSSAGWPAPAASSEQAPGIAIAAKPQRVPPEPSQNIAARETLAKQRPDDAAALADQAVAFAAQKRQREAVAAVGNALRKNPELRHDKRLKLLLFDAARDRDPAPETFGLLEGPMGAEGADVIYDLAIGEGARSDVRARAETWLRSKDFDRASSPALNIAVALRHATTCEQRYALLLRAKNVGDERSLVPLQAWKKTTGCGAKGSTDCNPCLRRDDRLEQSMREINARRKG